MSKILVIDDERSIRNTLKEILEFEDYKVDVASNGVEGLDFINKNEYKVIFCDIKMPEMDGLEMLEKIEKPVPIIMISGHGDISTAVEALKKGAVDFIEKPLDLNKILSSIKNVADNAAPSEPVAKKAPASASRKKTASGSNYEIIGESESLVEILKITDRVAATNTRVLITGSNGTGKELIARRLHSMSNRSDQTFVETNCAAIPSELIESELFGHEKGSFTSAHKQAKGKFEQANGGTLFLDEIGDMSLSAQSKVLRALQERKISRVGGTKDIEVDVRVVAATNKDLKLEIEKGTFREDLYHRLSVILIHLPPLCERQDDIPLLAEHFNEQICNEHGFPVKKNTSDAMVELKKKPWTGNVRELRNVMERLIVLCDNEITARDIKAYV